MTIPGRLVRVPLRLIPRRAVLPVLSGPLRGLRWVAGSAPHGAWLGTLERDRLRVFRACLRPGNVVWDVGANVGLYTLCAARAVGQGGSVHAFEPISENSEWLRRHIWLNGFENVNVEDRAVVDRDGIVRLAGGESPSEWRIDSLGSREVEAVALDNWRKRAGVPAPQVIKIDVEGSESLVLRGASETLGMNRPLVYLSLHGETQRNECRYILDRLGYRIRSWEPDEAIETTSEWLAEA